MNVVPVVKNPSRRLCVAMAKMPILCEDDRRVVAYYKAELSKIDKRRKESKR